MIDERIKIAEKIFNESIVDEYENALGMCADVLDGTTNKIEIYLAHEVRCSLFSSMGGIMNAINEVSAMIEIEGNQPHPFFKRARLFLRINKNSEAISDLTKVIHFNEEYFRETALLLRSLANLEIDKFQSIKDAMLLDDGFSCFVRTQKFGYKEISKEYLLKIASI